MKKIILLIAAGSFVFTSCTKTTMDLEEDLSAGKVADQPVHRNCYTAEVYEEQLKADPSLAEKTAAVERFTKEFTENPTAYRLVNGVIEIPVVFNVIYNTAAQNISTAQLQSQIDVLNEDFSNTNADYNASNPYNAVKAGAINIRF